MYIANNNAKNGSHININENIHWKAGGNPIEALNPTITPKASLTLELSIEFIVSYPLLSDSDIYPLHVQSNNKHNVLFISDEQSPPKADKSGVPKQSVIFCPATLTLNHEQPGIISHESL